MVFILAGGRWWLRKGALQPSEISLDQIPKANNFSSPEASTGPFQHFLVSKWLELSCTKARLSYYCHLYCGCLWVCVSWKPGSFRTLLGQKGIKMARVLLNLNWCLIGFFKSVFFKPFVSVTHPHPSSSLSAVIELSTKCLCGLIVLSS